jgi:hypothetical protein
LFDQADAGVEHVERQIGRIHIGLRPSDQRLDPVDAVFGEGAGVGLLR